MHNSCYSYFLPSFEILKIKIKKILKKRDFKKLVSFFKIPHKVRDCFDKFSKILDWLILTAILIADAQIVFPVDSDRWISDPELGGLDCTKWAH